jgi:nucleoside-diphosphate-sugar epimerase
LDAPCGGLVEAKGEYPHCPLYLQILFDWVANGSAIPVLGRGDNRYQFVHADDLADACMRAAARPGFAIYHVGTDRFGTMRETLEAQCAHAGTGSRVISVPKGLAVAAMQAPSWLGLSPLGPYHWLMYGESLWFDIARARAELGWQPPPTRRKPSSRWPPRSNLFEDQFLRESRPGWTSKPTRPLGPT